MNPLTTKKGLVPPYVQGTIWKITSSQNFEFWSAPLSQFVTNQVEPLTPMSLGHINTNSSLENKSHLSGENPTIRVCLNFFSVIFFWISSSPSYLTSKVIKNWFCVLKKFCLEESLWSSRFFVYKHHFISNKRLRLAYFEPRISENNEIWTEKPFQNNSTHSR